MTGAAQHSDNCFQKEVAAVHDEWAAPAVASLPNLGHYQHPAVPCPSAHSAAAPEILPVAHNHSAHCHSHSYFDEA